MTVGYLGPPGTFTETAARLITGGEVELTEFADVTEVLRAVESKDIPRGVVPIENTLEGSVTSTLDALAFDYDLLIQGELELPVHLVLAAPPGLSIDSIERVYSHPVALAACRRYLANALPGCERIPAASTTRAAEIAKAESRAGAILNPLAVERYGLETLAKNVADHEGNTTRFVVVGHELEGPTGWDKTSTVVFIEQNRPGALLKLLEVFAERDLNLTKIESRPTKHELGDYCFFIDVEGHVADERVGDALAAVKRTHRDVKILGSYRRSGARQTDEADRISADDQSYRDAAKWLAEWRSRVSTP